MEKILDINRPADVSREALEKISWLENFKLDLDWQDVIRELWP